MGAGATQARLAHLHALLQRCLARLPPLHAIPGPGAIGDGTDPGGEAIPAGPPLVPAAVLVPVIARASGPSILLTRRTDQLVRHAGQISFPGGHVETHDADYAAAALRETEEEIGLARDYVRVAGALDECRTVTGYRVVPVVGLVRPGFTLSPDAREVAAVFEVPLAHLFDPANHQRRSGEYRGRRRQYYLIEYQQWPIWGATAAMLVNFHARVAAADLVQNMLKNPRLEIAEGAKISDDD